LPDSAQVWLLASDTSLTNVRNHLVQQLGKLDMLFVIDATNDKAPGSISGRSSTRESAKFGERKQNYAPRADSAVQRSPGG